MTWEDPDTIPEPDEDVFHEECGNCHGECDGCLTCWDQGIVPHACGADIA